MLELGAGADTLRGLGWLYIGLIVVLVLAALRLPKRWWQKLVGVIVVLLVFAGPAYKCMRSLILYLAALSVLTLAGCEKYALDRQMEELCKKDGGLTVYEKVALPAGEFSKDGVPLARYWFDASLPRPTGRLGPHYRYVDITQTIKAGDPMKGEGRLSRYVEEIYRIKDEKLLGRSIQYGRAGGDGVVLGHWSTASCPRPQSLLTTVFVKGAEK